MALNLAHYDLKWRFPGRSLTDTRLRKEFSVSHPLSTRWLLELVPYEIKSGTLTFLTFLEYLPTNELPEVTVSELRTHVLLNGHTVITNRLLDWPYSEENKSFLQVDIDNYEENDNTLEIRLWITIRGEGILAARAEINGIPAALLYGDLTTNPLSSLNLFYYTNRYCTMNLLTRKTDLEIEGVRKLDMINAHHCILKERWSNLFTRHNLDSDVDTNISFYVLACIMDYMYSGDISPFYLIWDEVSLISELFQVIFRYQIFHLYEALRHIEVRIDQNRIDYSDVITISLDFQFVNNISRRQQSLTYPISVYPFADNRPEGDAHNFIFTVHAKVIPDAGLWLLYTLGSQTEEKFTVVVELKILGDDRSKKIVDTATYTINGLSGISSRPIFHLSTPEILSYSSNDADDEIDKKLDIGLTFQNENSNVSIWETSPLPAFFANPKETFYRHMGKALRERYRTDLEVELQDSLGARETGLRPIHKVIYHACLQEWYNAVLPIVPGNIGSLLPDRVVLPLRRESYYHVLEFMYTGRTLLIPQELRREITSFAKDGGFEALQKHVRSMP